MPRSPLLGFCVIAVPMLAAVLAGCALKAPPTAEELRPQALPNVTPPARWTAGGAAPGAVTDGWVASFASPELDALVAEAIAYNADLRVAAARVEQAQAYVKLAGGTLYPTVNLLAHGGGKMGGDSSGINGGGVFLSWELDLWGRVRATRAAATASYDAAQLDLRYAQQSIAALVAKSWIMAIEAKRQQALARDMVKAAEQVLRLSHDRQRVGRGDELDVTQAEANLENYRDAERQLAFSYEQSLRALETLLGRYPSAAVTVAAELPALPGAVPAGLPSELLERRPDVVAAERRVAAAFHSVEEAQAARLPRISLTASVTSVNSELFVLQNPNNPIWSVGGNLVAPLFTGFALEAQVEVRSAEQKAAVADYGRVGARAFGEVENALSGSFALNDREAILSRAAKEQERAVELAQVRYRVGSGDLRGVQQQMLALYTARTSLLRVQSEARVQRVNLYLALGGDFGPPSTTPVAARE